MEISKIYNPKKVEDKWYQFWNENKYFSAKVNESKKPYTIVIPPPNVTDRLHMGHAFNNTIQDVYIRYKRKNGFETLWQPGTDHAGIATQNAVERNLKKENISRHDLGRQKFVEKVWQWKEEYGSTIIHQLKKLGCSCDWERERFTMDEGLSDAVTEVFIRLYQKGLIYKGKYIINWCPRCSTALSDEEVEHRETHGHLWYFKYPIKDSNEFVVVATTRPETMLGDTAVAVNPNDERYAFILDKTIILPLMNREIPVIQDEYVDAEFGTGAVKVTPAHDPNDFLMGQRHNLQQINIMHQDGMLNENAGQYKDKDRFVARNQVVQDMESAGLLEKTTSHHHNVGHCHRCNTVVEPYLSEQWFVRVEPLAKPALEVVKQGKVKLYPHERWYKTYEHWMENVRDWCISRQLWWGHRIPVYYCQDCNEMMVSKQTPEACSKCNSKNIKQDEDVLDTWFSSWLWPFSTLGWPDKTNDLKYFYPTNLLVTGPDIIFFWVARMIMAGLEFMGDIPFKDVLLNGIIRDESGRKMSKSLGNGIDPLEMIEKFSADAVRFTVVMLSSEGQDINLSKNHFEMGRNFSNKIWNAFRFLNMHLEEIDCEFTKYRSHFELSDLWIISRFQKTIKELNSNLDRFKVNEGLNAVYHFFWHDYCDWYLELIKKRLYNEDDEVNRNTALAVASFIMKKTMNLLHPYIPFITEEVWQRFKCGDESSIVIADWPKVNEDLINEKAEQDLVWLQNAISAIRNLRAEMNVPPGKMAPLYIRAKAEKQELINNAFSYFNSLAKVESISDYNKKLDDMVKATVVVEDTELFVPLADLIDIEVEKNRLSKEIERLEGINKGITAKLQNKNFVDRAPENIVKNEKEKLHNNDEKLEKLIDNLNRLK